MAVKMRVVEYYRNYKIIKIMTPADLIYNAVKMDGIEDLRLITCSADTVDDIKNQIDAVHARIEVLDNLYARGKGKRR
ncbi:MAG: hypothetical protein J5691_00265 [Bacilli bacterium]|nr:hypothetical protein [Bacilli bacterium]